MMRDEGVLSRRVEEQEKVNSKGKLARRMNITWCMCV